MTFRTEEKLRLSIGKSFDFKEWLEKNEGKLLYPDRLINSIYFDTFNHSMYEDSMEGVLPRKKIRLRQYSKHFLFTNKINKEIKISSVEGRFKTSKIETDVKKIMNFGIFDEKYGICHPTINVSYNRSYYQIKGIRLTIDRDIIYRKVNKEIISSYKIKDITNVVELKYTDNNLTNSVINNFPFEKARFSKYCRAIEFTKVNRCDEI